jgi:hypothetical protein
MKTMPKKKIHEFIIRVRFDRPCTTAHALRETKDNVHGNFYPVPWADKDPEEAWIKSIKRLPTNRQTSRSTRK